MDNNRQDYRIGKTETFIIEIKSSADSSDGDFELLVCDSVDLSSNGFRAVVDKELPLNAIYQIAVELKGEEKLFLAGQVKWTGQREGSDDYYIGIEILDSSGTDVRRWKLYIAEQLMQDNEL